jgi:hypothetical protein
MKNLRILHVLSPVKWKGDTFNAKADANWKVAEKTINWLPNCHHYILAPLKHNITLKGRNITFLKYDYPKSVQLNRGMFDYRNIKFDFTRCDIDFVFNHQPELTFNIQQWFHSNRYFESPKYFGFYHWIDCKQSRGSVSGCPSFYMRQLESMHILDGNFIHSTKSLDYLKSNFKNIDVSNLISKTYEMPLSSRLDVEPTPFELPNKKILVFNHRWAKSSGVKKLLEYTKDLSNDYLIWVTDETCDIKDKRFIVKSLKYSDYAYLMEKCYASLCFIDGYTTWNLSAQDSTLKGKPLLYLKHDMIKKVVGEDNGGSFTNKVEFENLILNLPKVDDYGIIEHDLIFELQLKTALKDNWHDTKGTPKDSNAWIENIKNGVVDKKEIAFNVNPKVRLNATAHFIRRNLLNNGISDNINEPYTRYYIEGNEKTIKRDLFSMI